MHRCAAIVTSLALLGVAACSGNGDDSGDAPVSSSEGAVDVTITDGGDTTEPGGTAEPSDTTEGASASDAEFCNSIEAIRSADFELEETFGPEAREIFDDVQASAPPEIADDVATVIATLDAIAELGISTDENDPVAIDAALEILLDPDFTEASENLEDFTAQSCGIDLGAGDDDDLELDDLDGFDDI